MDVEYRGFRISAKRERALGGWDNLYCSIHRISDGRECYNGFTTDESPARIFIKFMKQYIDEELAENPLWPDTSSPEG